MKDAVAGKMMMRVVEGYERLAEHAEACRHASAITRGPLTNRPEPATGCEFGSVNKAAVVLLPVSIRHRELSPDAGRAESFIVRALIPVVTSCGVASPISSTSIGSSHITISQCQDIIVKHQWQIIAAKAENHDYRDADSRCHHRG